MLHLFLLLFTEFCYYSQKDSLTPKNGEPTFLQTGATHSHPLSYGESSGMPETGFIGFYLLSFEPLI